MRSKAWLVHSTAEHMYRVKNMFDVSLQLRHHMSFVVVGGATQLSSLLRSDRSRTEVDKR